MGNARYRYYRDVFNSVTMPFAFVDLDGFDANLHAILARAGSTPIRVASKSIRCVTLLQRILSASGRFHSIMSYSVREALFLAGHGFEDILVAYPAWREVDTPAFRQALEQGVSITLMVDCAGHVERLERIGAETGAVIPLCMDLDMSARYPGLHFGVLRSSIRTAKHALALWDVIRRCPHVSLTGVMGYEAQVASLPDRTPGRVLRSLALRHLKRRSVSLAAARRGEIVEALREAGWNPGFVNGGGTGSIETTRADPVVTETTVGSGFFAPACFDHYDALHLQPAAGFAIEIVRQPRAGCYTCHGGGYIASGAAGPDKLPVPYLPEGARLSAHEGAGEVQTPVFYTGPEKLNLGDPIFMRHGKAGELCERFNTLLLVSEGRIVDEMPTYRGEGQCFV